MQVTVVNEKVQSPKNEGQSNESVSQSRQQHAKNWSKAERGQQGSRGQGQNRRYGPRPERNQKYETEKSFEDKYESNKTDIKETDTRETGSRTEKSKCETDKTFDDRYETSKTDAKEIGQEKDKNELKEDIDKDPKQELFIVPSRPSTIGQEAQRSSPIVGDDKNESVNESAPPVIEVKPKPNMFGNIQSNKTKSRSFDKLNKTESWDEEDYYPDPSKLGTLVFERSRSSEQLNLTGKNARPPIPRSASGGVIKSPKKYAFSALRKRTDSFSSDISTGML